MIYQFSSISLNTNNKQLHINGQPIETDDRMICLLIELIRRYPGHCSKQDILDNIWPNRVVSQWSVSRLVFNARHLFKQHGYHLQVIQTLHGRGYRLNPELGQQLPVMEGDNSHPDENLIPNHQKNITKKKFNHSITASIVLLFMAIGWLAIQYFTTAELLVSEPKDSIGRLLWVDDHIENNAAEKSFFEKNKIRVYQVKSTEEALISLALYEYKLVISDMGRGDNPLAGLHLLKSLREKKNATPFILYSIVFTEAQQQLISDYNGQGVAVKSEQLYDLVLPFYQIEEK